MKVIIADKMDTKAQTVLANLGLTVDARPANGEISIETIIGEADALLVRSATTVDAALIAKAPNLKVIGRAGIGVDNIDITAASNANIIVMNTPMANAISTAEHTLALLFAVARHVPQANTSTHAGHWEKNRFTGVELSHKTLGIIGCGNIGKIVANRAQGLKMHVCAFDPMLSDAQAAENQIEKVSLVDLFARSDFITLHTPLTADTKHIIDADAIAKMKTGVYLINAARGGLIDETVLKAALDSGQIAGVAMDVFAEEPLTQHPLMQHPRVILTPHIAAATKEAQDNVAIQIAEQVGGFLTTGAITHAINTHSLKP
ncbi:hydroxyacid dehydrogenase [Ostreibacterium oceani]|uniref:D-3-phosphoglycerate dehydrogenase n=1 Tax=Ostreibacterium oceani TaxID=2654998 RepID=A0A6N7EZP6_9GAMM|nr:hydroxyacid dehydrogenase [Ostreibacterium oceani]MPV86839.1 hypothetical protein [Ostreibacterium oceani]